MERILNKTGKYVLVAMLLLMTGMLVYAKGDGKGEMKFETTTHDFGTIKESDGPVTCEFEFVNVGNGNLSITEAKAQCGCTRPTYPTAPVKPGKKNKIKVTYNPTNRPGAFTKTITVYLYNCNKKKMTLKIKGTVLPK